MRSTTEGVAGWAKFITTVGVPSAIALYLVWQLTAGIASASQVEIVSSKMDAHAAATERRLEDILRAVEAQVRLSRSICRSVARNDAARLECGDR